ncbi:DUF7385 family protein [Halopenitus persicus]|uniref:Uncharacterized protein n=1 Tax=Halopenitus persicus TaxID=1048396 RepID=A0A1H3INX4_9EURY|nr:hypothetical protein [Halopenitus persicus]QHS17170.1 hypothetical protein GWK26_08465 [haloarchaeon 3A1-DGR]SDY29391.1 hypothetical protein SAMN05216564_104201 [Halopenitus persicus]
MSPETGDEDRADGTDDGLTEDELRELTDGLVKHSSGGGTTVYKNAAGVGCPNPNCDRGIFRTLFVSDTGWQELGATREGVHLCLTSTDEKRLVFIHEE